jgi:choline dehydrogenase
MTGSFDVVIVGAGSAGCALACRLSEDAGRRVLLLEAGPDHREVDLPDELRFLSRPVAWPHDWGDQVVTVGDRLLTYARGRGVGGSSSTNGGVAMRAEPADFAAWPSGWQWDEMLPYFCRLERDLDFGDAPWHGSQGPIPIVRWPREQWAPLQIAFHDACRQLGFPDCPDHNQPGTTGVGPIPMNREGRQRVSSLLAYVEPARDRPNLVIRGGSHVRRILVDHGRGGRLRAGGVELVDGEVVPAGQVIISSGVVQNPLLLWRSGIGPAEAVRRLGVEPLVDLPGVGANLSDHFVMSFSTEISPDIVPDDAPSIQTILRTTAPDSEHPHDLQLTPWVRRHADGRREIGISVSLQLPDGTGFLTPTTADPGGPARITWPFTAEPANVRRMRQGWRLAANICQASQISIDKEGLAGAAALPDAELDELIATTHTAFYHGCGTCRMGDFDDPQSVVDPELRVRGVDGLLIVDASIIPKVPRSNTHIVVTALAERAATLI